MICLRLYVARSVKMIGYECVCSCVRDDITQRNRLLASVLIILVVCKQTLAARVSKANTLSKGYDSDRPKHEVETPTYVFAILEGIRS